MHVGTDCSWLDERTDLEDPDNFIVLQEKDIEIKKRTWAFCAEDEKKILISKALKHYFLHFEGRTC